MFAYLWLLADGAVKAPWLDRVPCLAIKVRRASAQVSPTRVRIPLRHAIRAPLIGARPGRFPRTINDILTVNDRNRPGSMRVTESTALPSSGLHGFQPTTIFYSDFYPDEAVALWRLAHCGVR
jgi:hypothetical protein